MEEILTEYEKVLKAENEILRVRIRAAEIENQQLRELINMQARRLHIAKESESLLGRAHLSFCF